MPRLRLYGLDGQTLLVGELQLIVDGTTGKKRCASAKDLIRAIRKNQLFVDDAFAPGKQLVPAGDAKTGADGGGDKQPPKK